MKDETDRNVDKQKEISKLTSSLVVIINENKNIDKQTEKQPNYIAQIEDLKQSDKPRKEEKAVYVSLKLEISWVL